MARTKGLHGPNAYEFVYLDDVATQSLTATIDGGIIQNSKSSEHVTTEASNSLAAGGSILGTKGALRHSVTRGIEVQRQEVAESHFARLGTLLRQHRLLQLSAPYPKRLNKLLNSKWERFARKLGNPEELQGRIRARGLAESTSNIARGSILELEVDVEEPHLYMLVAATESFAEFAEVLRKAQPGTGLMQQTDIDNLRKMMLWMRGGLVPMLGRVVSHVVARRGKDQLIVHVSCLDHFPVKGGWTHSAFNVAGFCNANSFWQEPSRVFMQAARFRCLVRVENANLNAEWDGLDHLQIFDAVGTDIRSAARLAIANMKYLRDHHGQAPSGVTLGQILETYNAKLADRLGVSPQTTGPLSVLQDQWATRDPSEVPALARADLQRKIEAFYAPQAGTMDLESLRKEAFAKYGRTQTGATMDLPLPSDSSELPDESIAEALRVQFIGIYW